MPQAKATNIAQSTPLRAEGKRGAWSHVVCCLLPQLPLVLFGLGIWGRGYWLLVLPLFLLVVVPLLDLISGWQDDARFEREDFSPVARWLLNWNTRIYALVYMAAIIYVATSIRRFNPIEIGSILLASSFLGGLCFAAAHELLHAKSAIDQFLQRIVTTFLFYPHYKVIHIRSHHVHAGTAEDENTAWFNESIYAYIARTIPGSAVRSWHLEARRSAGASGAGILRNKMSVFAAGQVATLLVMYLISGPWGLLFYAAHILGSHLVLESVNYIQHYGLLRKQEDGEYEKTAAEHSWDTYHFFSSYIAFRVGHHSYHHLAVKPYYLLNPEPEAPKLPVGYFWAMPMVLLPPWWRKAINPRVPAAP